MFVERHVLAGDVGQSSYCRPSLYMWQRVLVNTKAERQVGSTSHLSYMFGERSNLPSTLDCNLNYFISDRHTTNFQYIKVREKNNNSGENFKRNPYCQFDNNLFPDSIYLVSIWIF